MLFFSVLQDTLAGRPLPANEPEGAVRFHVGTLQPAWFDVVMRHAGCRVVVYDAPPDDGADLHVFADATKLDALAKGEADERPLRLDGNDKLLGVMARISEPGMSPLMTRLAGG